ncbi:NAD(P)H-dependent oxidoreductase [Qipengyuania sp. GH25]|uniref:FMN dependent NADH:quinone oxidoreductase n=1 Tax=Qipengyuania pacifica TaxID=2860199 RepID=A0ABS7JKA7_9SPHN|nr:NAD(P)H-dependent oxidoreductase [Qipengyuania aerophila]MBX7489822.1 NAD(P)H-dependent oxidoreductase [Qipengyuania aerophila]
MSRLLLLHASPLGSEARGSTIAYQACNAWQSQNPRASIVERDLNKLALEPLQRGYVEAIVDGSPHHHDDFTLSEELIQELEACSRLVIATPMHNFTVPSSLKLWIDYVLRHGRTFTYQSGRKVGSLQDKPTTVIVTSGGMVTGAAASQPDHLTQYLRDVFGTMGISNVRFVYLEGMARLDVAMDMLEAGRRALATDPLFAGSV